MSFMKALVLGSILLCGFSPSGMSAENPYPKKIVIGFIPGEDPEVLKKHGLEFAKLLSQKLGVGVDIFIPKNYVGLVDAMKEKRVDFAFLTALTFVEAEALAGAKVLLKKVWEGPFYWSSIVSKANGPKKISDLKGKVFGFVDEKSASGYLYPTAMLEKSGIYPKRFFKEIKFLGSHDAAIQALERGEVDAAAVFSDGPTKTGAWTRYSPKMKVNIVWTSEPIPNDPFCVTKEFYEKNPKFTHDLMFTLLEFRDDPKDKETLNRVLGISSLDLATSRQYDPVRDLQKYLQQAQLTKGM